MKANIYKFALCLLVGFSVFSFPIKAQFNLGHLVVLQIGNGASTLTNTGNPLILNEYSTNGTATFSVAIPSTGANAMLLRGNATSEGYISRTSDDNYIAFGGYLQALPNSSVLNTSSASSVNRGIGLVNSAGAFTVGASSASFFSGGDIRGAAGTGSANLWASSSNQGLNYFGPAVAQTNVENSKTNLRAAHVFNNQLYISSQVLSGTPSDIGVFAVGSGTPNTAGQTVTTAINTGTASQPGQFYFNTNSTICYVADSRNSALGGVQKWVYSAGSWSLAYTLPTGTAAIGAFGVVADFSSLTPKVYATTTEGSNNRLVAITDVGANATATTLATASPSTIFRGLAFSPVASTCIPVSVTTVSNNSPVCSENNLILNLNVTGTAPYTYTWSGTGQFSSISVANPTVVNASTGSFVVTVANACSTASAATNVTINPTPTIIVNAPTICSGGIATITATGANSYSWNTGSTNSTFTASPLNNTNYTVTGTSLGCSKTATTSIIVNNNPNMSVSSATICAGKTATLLASGASSYTWSNGSNAALISVSPSVTTSYTVGGSVSGCTVQLTGTANVLVNPLPVVSLSLPQTVFCVDDAPLALNATPAGGTYTGKGTSAGVFSPTIGGIGTYTLSYAYTDAKNCSAADTKVVTVSACTSLLSLKISSPLTLYPNPAKDKLHMSGLNLNDFTQVEFYNVEGKKVGSHVLSSNNPTLDIRELSPGIYHVLFSGAESVYTTKFMKE